MDALRDTLIDTKELEKIYPEGFALGRQLGYPECCIKAFALRAICYDMGVPELTFQDHQNELVGTGYLPCEACDAKPADELRAYITAHRDPELTPFPELFFDEHGPIKAGDPRLPDLRAIRAQEIELVRLQELIASGTLDNAAQAAATADFEAKLEQFEAATQPAHVCSDCM